MEHRTPSPAAGFPALLGGPLPAEPVEAMHVVRRRTLALTDGLGDADLERQIAPILSPLAWDLAHIAAYEDLWIAHRHGSRPLLRGEWADVYDAFETPRTDRGDAELLDAHQARRYLADVRARTVEVTDERGVDPVLHEMVLQHEMQHTETMLQALRIAGIVPWLESLPAAEPEPAHPWATAPAGVPPTAALTADAELLDVSGGEVRIGAPDHVFSYDNERPRHAERLAPYRIARRPVSVATWRAFVDDGGRDHRRWWTDDGWAWRRETATASATGPPEHVDGAAPACHLSWFEAAAIAAWAGLRLPTEAEWEHAATGDRLERTGAVWEWTSTVFCAYPGFCAHPYPEYSEVFFDRGYRVLRGGSFATHPRIGTRTFRNWDLPQRAQIFSGARLAGDAA